MATKREFIDHVRGKVIERIVIVTDADALELDIQFQDNTSLAVQLEADIQVRVEKADLVGWKNGNGHILRQLL